MKYRAEIDGLRALAVIPVILYHADFNAFSGGFVGVDVFFVISGYLITSIIVTELDAGTFSLINFYERRARRILPALFLVIFSCLPFSILWLTPADLKRFSQSVVAVNLFLSNFFFYHTSQYFDTATELKPLIHTWSLAVEEQYYVAFPLFLMLCWKLGKKWIATLLLIFALASLAIAQFGNFFSNPLTLASFNFYLLPTRAWEIIIGALIALYYLNGNVNGHKNVLKEAGSAIGVALILYAIFTFDEHTPAPSLYTLMPTLGTALIIIFATHETVIGNILRSKLFCGMGLISYGAYLWHQPLLAFAKYRSLNKPSYFLMAILSIASILLAYLSLKYVEGPFRTKQFFSRKQIILFSAIVSTTLIGIGMLGTLSNGLLFSYNDNDKELAKVQFTSQMNEAGKSFDKFYRKTFSLSDGRKKILIIGDSFAEDLTEAIIKSGIDQEIQISTRHIIDDCGNLFIEQKIFSSYIDKNHRWRCRNENGIFEDKDLRTIMRSADEIWFASNWHYWQVPFVPESVMNVEIFTGKRVRVFGQKDFGVYKISHLMRMSESDRIQLKKPVDKDFLRTNELLKSSLSSDIFIDSQKLFCGDQADICRIFTDDGKLISFDGQHLTRYGQILYGDKLKQFMVIN